MQSDILIFGGVIVGILVGFLMAYFMQGAKISAIASTLNERTSERDKSQAQEAELTKQLSTSLQEVARLEQKAELAENLSKECNALREQISNTQNEVATLRNENLNLQRREKENNDQRREDFAKQLELIKEKLQKETYELLENKTKSLNQANSDSIDALLKPYQESLKQMKEAIDSTRENSTRNTASLSEKIEQMLRSSAQLSQEADRLAHALTNKTKVQGDWGEAILDRLLESSGLQLGKEYYIQKTIRDEHGEAVKNSETEKKMKPDVVVYYPDNSAMYIDSKVSLKAFVEYCNAESEEEREAAIKRHIDSVAKHVKELATKKYAQYKHEGRTPLPYTIMFIPNDSAMQLALLNDRSLWSSAFEQGVFITSEQNLLLVLRLIRNAWVQQAQIDSQEEVYNHARNLLERIADFSALVDSIGVNLQEATKHYNQSVEKLYTGKQSIMTSARLLDRLGLKIDSKKQRQLDKHLGKEEE